MEGSLLKPVVWMGNARTTLKKFPAVVREEMGYALYLAQKGDKHPNAKPLKGLGSGVLEIISDHRGDTYRVVYVVRFKGSVYVLHAFQKKAKRGIATPKSEVHLIEERLKQALRLNSD